jgi:hypothetical protein
MRLVIFVVKMRFISYQVRIVDEHFQLISTIMKLIVRFENLQRNLTTETILKCQSE